MWADWEEQEKTLVIQFVVENVSTREKKKQHKS